MSVVEGLAVPRDSARWCAQYRIGDEEEWSECRLLDISLTGALVELAGDVPDLPDVPDAPGSELPFVLQIDSIAEDEVGISMRAVVRSVGLDVAGRPVADVEFSARREERILLHLLVRLHELV